MTEEGEATGDRQRRARDAPNESHRAHRGWARERRAVRRLMDLVYEHELRRDI